MKELNNPIDLESTPDGFKIVPVESCPVEGATPFADETITVYVRNMKSSVEGCVGWWTDTPELYLSSKATSTIKLLETMKTMIEYYRSASLDAYHDLVTELHLTREELTTLFGCSEDDLASYERQEVIIPESYMVILRRMVSNKRALDSKLSQVGKDTTS